MASWWFILASVIWLVVSVSQSAAQTNTQELELAEEAQNPIANLISVPFQNNTNFNVGGLGNDRRLCPAPGSNRVFELQSALQAAGGSLKILGTG